MYICYNNAMFNNNTQCQLVKLLDFNALLLLFSQASLTTTTTSLSSNEKNERTSKNHSPHKECIYD